MPGKLSVPGYPPNFWTLIRQGPIALAIGELMNTKSNIFTLGSATRENTTFGVHSVK